MSLLDSVHSLFGSAFSISRGYIPGHDGVDIPAKEGTPVRAVADGVVEYARDARTQADKGAKGWAMGGGNVVNINVGGRLATQYAHLQSFTVVEGQRVKKGDIIGYVGRTGGVNKNGSFGGPGAQFVGAHVHFGLWDHEKNKMINPTQFLANAVKTGSNPSDDLHDSRPPGAGNADVQTLGAFNDIVSFPVGHIITATDVDTIMGKLESAGYFKDDPTGAAKRATQVVLATAIGKQWDKPLQDDLQAKLLGAAGASGDFLGLQSVATALGDIGNLFSKFAAYAVAVVFIVVGLFIYTKAGQGVTGVPSVVPE